ncbi:MAG: RNA polymerase sigma factor [Oleibacter sp.]|nr:RNA polymerase sigma factor [Thalassolituus sp.]
MHVKVSMDAQQHNFKQALIALLPKLRRYCFALTNHRQDAEDLLQAAVERALVRWQQFEIGTEMDRWMYRLCRNLWIDTMRKNSPTDTLTEALTERFSDTLVTLSAEQQFEQATTLRYVQDQMGRLSEGLRMVLYLVAVEGRSYQETATILDIPAGTVMSRLSRARQQLSNACQDISIDPSDALQS